LQSNQTNSLFMGKNYVNIDLGPVKNSCFVVMPFHNLYEIEYEKVIKPAIEESGLECIRGDEIYAEQEIIHDIWKSLKECRLVVAELSGRNPNVLYEIGLAHAIGKPIILITRNQEDVPFDLKALRYIYYDTNNPEWGQTLKTDLTKKIRGVLDNPAFASHLKGIEVITESPEIPEETKAIKKEIEIVTDISGVWVTSWNSVVRNRRHDANLVILSNHGNDFVATMTVSYTREDKKTIVMETMTGTIKNSQVRLTGVGYTFIEWGSARSYGLDSFELQVSEDGYTMAGKAILKHGTREVVFKKIAARNNV